VVFEGIKLPTLDKDTCARYHNAVIAYLRKLAEDEHHVQDENLLAAAVIERYYGELDSALQGREDNDSQFATFNLFFRAQAQNASCDVMPASSNGHWSRHPLPSTSSHHHRTAQQPRVNNEAALHQLKSFQHACFRVALRQEVTTAFLKQRSITLPLCSTWSLLDTFADADTPDFVWADRHLHHCAKVLQFCFGDSQPGSARDTRLSLASITGIETHQDQGERWKILRNYHEEWERRKPLSYSPIDEWGPTVQVHGSNGAAANFGVFPKIWYMAETHVVALQYLTLARILLDVYIPNTPQVGTGAAVARKRVSEEVRELVMRVCGTALSRNNSQPARMQAFMAVSVCGERFENLVERMTLLKLLDGLTEDFGWPTDKVQNELREVWGWPLLKKSVRR
jgi:hypothetical protein